MRRLAAALLLVVGAALLLVGRAAEDEAGDESTEAVATPDEGAEAGPAADGEEAAGGEGGQAEGSEAAEGDEAAGGEGGQAEGEEAEEGEETLLGVDVESPLAIVGAMVVSLLLAVGLVASRARPFAIAAVGVGVVFAVFDGAELALALDEAQAGTAVLAGVVAVAHLAAAAAAGLSLRSDVPTTA